jgi:hypothetical protein
MSFQEDYTYDALLNASNLAVDFLAENIDENGMFVAPGAEEDLCFYYKLPMALFLGGKLREADRVLDHIKQTFLQPNGDFRTSADVKTCSFALNEYYPYTNGWIVMAAQRMERYDIVDPGLEYLEAYMQSGLFPTNGPPQDGNLSTDIFTASHFGMIALTNGGRYF